MSFSSGLWRFASRLIPATKFDVDKILLTIMSAQTDLAAKLATQATAIDGLTTQLGTIGTEIDTLTTLIQTLKDAIDNAPVDPSVQTAVDAIDASITRAQAAAQADVDKNPGTPATPPANP